MVLAMKVTGHADLVNPSFEDETGWIISSSGSDFNAYYGTDWASQGMKNFTLLRNIGSVSARTYAEISQTVDLSDVIGLYFDCQDTGIDGNFVFLCFFVGNTLVGSWGNQSSSESGTWGQTETA